MPRRLIAAAVSLALLVSVSAPVAPVGAAEACDPFLTTPVYDPSVRTATQVLGADFDFGVREMAISEKGVVPEVNEFNEYLATLDADTDRVVTAEAATSVDGKSIRYAIVGREDRMDADSLAAIRANLQVLRNPSSSGPALQAALDDTPAVLWVAGNVHGGEESGADAAMHALYELAARTDCVVEGILDNAIVVILPTQNPDGRAIGQRRNLYGFDMNRDWFARTQPETDGKLDVVRLYPPMLFLDVHEFGLADYFFPPNADPIYHEIPEQANDWINGLYSPAIIDQFQAEGIKFFHGAPYDFFAVVFGDTVPATGHHAAGMTLEKESGDPIAVREHEHFTATWASIAAGAAARDAVVARLARLVRRGVRAGPRRHARGERRLRAEAQAPPAGSGRHGPRLLPRERPRQGLRARPARPSPPADGRQRLPADGRPPSGRLPSVRRSAGRDRPAGRDVLDPAGAGPEALDPGDAERGDLDPVRRHVRRDGVEQPAAHGPGGRLVRRERRTRGVGRSPGRPAGLGWRRWDAVRRAVRDPDQHARLRGRVPDEVPLHRGLAPAVRGRHGRRDRRGPPQRPREPDRRPRHARRLRELRPAGARRQGQAGAPRLGQRRRHDRRLAGRRGGRREGGCVQREVR